MRKALSLLTIFLTFASLVTAAEYHVDRSAKNVVKFISEAPLEEFDGVTDKIDGYLRWTGDQIPPDQTNWQSCELYFEVELNGLDTGIGLRNRHMRDDFLETDKFPYASFKGHLKDLQKTSDTLYTAVAEGTFNVHGVDKPLNVNATVIPSPAGLRVQCNFEVKLPDYNIKIPKLLFMKVNEVIRLQVDYYLKPATDKK
jgi:polyisoprenoid-binding protein YceI